MLTDESCNQVSLLMVIAFQSEHYTQKDLLTTYRLLVKYWKEIRDQCMKFGSVLRRLCGRINVTTDSIDKPDIQWKVHVLVTYSIKFHMTNFHMLTSERCQINYFAISHSLYYT